jgi:PAS domain S-box-containing protein
MQKMFAPTGNSSSTWFDTRGLRAFSRLAILCLLVCSRVLAADPPPRQDVKKVLIVNTFSDLSLDNVNYLKSAMRAHVPWTVDYYVEYLENWRLGNEGYENAVFNTLEHEYVGEKLDLISTVSYPALQFVLKYRDRLFPGVPIVFWGLDASRVVGQRWPGVTGVTEVVDVRGTIDLALRLHPKTNTVAIITTTSQFDKYWLGAVHTELLRHQDKVRVIDLMAFPTNQLLQKVAALPDETVILFQPSPPESVQPSVGIYDILASVGQQFPVYCIMPIHCINHGGIGGVSTDMETQAALASEISRRVLSGERPENISYVHDTQDNRVRVDWRQLQRWKIPESALPPGSLLFYKQPTLWERYRVLIILALALIAIQALLIIGLLWQRARKRKAEAVLRESEERFRVMADTTPSLIWMCNAQGKFSYLNERWLAFTGQDAQPGFRDSWIEYIHPDDLKNVLDGLWQALKDRKPFSREYRLHRNDGAYRWMFDVASPRVNGDGSFAGFIGSAIDVTEQKLAQQALENVSGQLIEAQEKERTRIARDLHDDICQRLALLSMELEEAKRDSNGRASATKSLEEIRKHCSEIAGDVQSLSHQLHSSKLDYLGAAAAIRGFTKEFSKKYGVRVEFSEGDVPKHLPKDVSLCLFRVAQEALHNAVKYSGVSQFKVELSATADSVQLEVTDTGAGFDVDAVKENRGLGLVSMQERVNLVHGKFSVESKPRAGSRILAVVPLISVNGQAGRDCEVKGTASVRELA